MNELPKKGLKVEDKGRLSWMARKNHNACLTGCSSGFWGHAAAPRNPDNYPLLAQHEPENLPPKSRSWFRSAVLPLRKTALGVLC